MEINNSINALNTIEQTLKKVRKETGYISSLNTLINERLAILGSFLCTNNNTFQNQLGAFIHRYIDHAIEYVRAYQHLAEATAIERYTHPYLCAAADYFNKEHPILSQLFGLHNHLSRAYLCHRLLEELNDKITIERKWPLAPTDTTYPNLIVHTLLGDESANLLDQDVLIRIELINAQHHSHDRAIIDDEQSQQLLINLCQQGWQNTLQEWPVLKEDLAELLH